jgi:ATP-dependent DNA helicase RecQ
MTTLHTAALREAHRRFGHDSFRPGQAEVIGALLDGRDALAVFPTGGGKSLCYQLPALLLPGTTLVVSPLIALIRDQLAGLHRCGIPAAGIDSAQSFSDRQMAERAFAAGALKLLYVSPERLLTPAFLELAARREIPLVAVDEAHCVVRWGHDFRPAYLEIGAFLQRTRPGRIGAFTATATPGLRGAIANSLGLRAPAVIVHGFLRPNLHLTARKIEGGAEPWLAAVREAVAGREGAGPALVYVTTRKIAEELAAALGAGGLRTAHYHGNCTPEQRARAQRGFLADGLDALVATRAFGMGVDKPDLRLVVHAQMPGSFEDYYQEVGRAGRDGAPARGMILWRGQDFRTHDFLINLASEDGAARDPEMLRAARQRLNIFHQALGAQGCLWRSILDYFDDPDAGALAAGGCGACSRCAQRCGAVQVELEVREAHIANVILRAASLRRRFGRRKLVLILAGSAAQGVPATHPAFSALKEVPQAEIERWVRALLDEGYLGQEGDEYPVIALTAKGAEALETGETLTIARAAAVPGGCDSSAKPSAALQPADPGLEARLRAWRRARAQQLGKPAYVVFSDKTLLAIAATRPANSAQLLAVPGIGPARLESFGQELLALLSSSSGASEIPEVRTRPSATPRDASASD